MKTTTRREFLALGTGAILGGALPRAEGSVAAPEGRDPALAGEIGITGVTLASHMAPRSKAPDAFTLLDLPKILRDDLDMRVLDVNTVNFPVWDLPYLEKFRAAAADAGCILTNLKLNQRGVALGSPDAAERERALSIYKQSVDYAALMGIRWVRPLLARENPEMGHLVDSHRALADYAAEKKVAVLIENTGWMQADPDSVDKLIKAIDRNLGASPDTGNWDSNAIRYEGLEKTFPHAVTCDFQGAHPRTGRHARGL